MAVRRNLTLADGQVAATATEIATGPSDDGGRVNLTFCNVGSAEETLILTMSRNGGSARRLCRKVLAPNEELWLGGIPLNQSDSLKAATSNAEAVDYTVSKAPEEAAMTCQVFDENGTPKSVSAILEQLAQVLD